MANNKYPETSKTIKIGPITVRNRTVYPTWQLNYANTDGTVSDKLMKYYTDLAEGGCGLIVTGCAVVTTEGVPFDRVMLLTSDDHIPGLEKLFKAIKEHGATPGLQLVHYGRQSSTSFSGDVLMAPSAIPCPMMSQYDPEYKVREMNIEDIRRVRDQFIDAAERAYKAGVELVEVHACHGYLLNEFLSPYSNKRTDNYGGSVENRVRLPLEIISGIRERLGNKIAIGFRISGDEYVDGGMKAEDFKEMVPLLEEAGMDMLSVSGGVYEQVLAIVPPKDMGETPHLPHAIKIKEFTTVPVCVAGSIISKGLQLAEKILSETNIDLIAMGRAQHADPYLVKKSMEGREEEINGCIHCNSCTFWTTGDPEVYCKVNKDYMKP